MKFEQFTYTGSPWGATAPGWTVFQSSSGVGADTASVLKPYFQFAHRPAGADASAGEVDGQRLPVRLAFAVNPETGRRIVAQSLDAGLRWYDRTRGRDYFAHVFVESRSGGGERGTSASFNPVALFLSPSFQTEFPQEFRDEALKIMNGERTNGPTPELPVVDSLDDILQNGRFSDDALFDRFPAAAFGKLGGVVAALAAGKTTVYFDATKPEGIDAMAAGVRLLPLQLRMKLDFVTWIPQNEIQKFPVATRLAFVGTIREGEKADPDTGLYGTLPAGGPEFKSREDVELFKRMVDAGGTELTAGDFDALVACWEVAAGRNADAGALRRAAEFAGRFPGMKDEIAAGLAAAFADYNYDALPRNMKLAGVVAGYELGFDSFRSDFPGSLDDFVRDAALFSDALRTLANDEARAAFADAVFRAARDSSDLSGFADTLRGCGGDVRRMAGTAARDGDFSKFSASVDRVDGIRQDASGGRVAMDAAGAALAGIDAAEDEYGAVFGDLDGTRNALRYLRALDGLTDAGDLQAFADEAAALGVDVAKMRADVLDRIKPCDVPADRLAGMLDAFGAVGIGREELLALAVESAARRGRAEGAKDGERRAADAEKRAADAESRRGVPVLLAAVAAAVCLAAGFAGGWFVRAFVAPKASAAQSPSDDAAQVLPSEPAVPEEFGHLPQERWNEEHDAGQASASQAPVQPRPDYQDYGARQNDAYHGRGGPRRHSGEEFGSPYPTKSWQE